MPLFDRSMRMPLSSDVRNLTVREFIKRHGFRQLRFDQSLGLIWA
ncbi:hypothetical protein TK90_2803 (plasmid) [Thioalkalivibrio sp. K90mix]|nr:hypothetical protein TK90_2803 [Thioalkalivibrio sp. K90mix]